MFDEERRALLVLIQLHLSWSTNAAALYPQCESSPRPVRSSSDVPLSQCRETDERRSVRNVTNVLPECQGPDLQMCVPEPREQFLSWPSFL